MLARRSLRAFPEFIERFEDVLVARRAVDATQGVLGFRMAKIVTAYRGVPGGGGTLIV